MNPSIAHSVARVQAWLLALTHKSRLEIADRAEIDEKTLRLAAKDNWDPRSSTLRKLEALMPADFPVPTRRPKTKRKAAA